MIKRISSIKQFGVYNDFKWDANVPDFNDKNIIYGWNYTGKTTLSRLFKILSHKIKIEAAENIDFSILLDDGRVLTKANYLDQPLDAIVFNSDFIGENLHFDSVDPKIKGILFDIGEESVETREKLRIIETDISNINVWLENNHQYIDKFAEFENLFTVESKKIKNENFESSIEFNKGHFKRILDTIVPNSLQSLIIDASELNELRANALAKEPLPKINEAMPTISFQALIDETNSCLSSEPALVEDEDVLTNNPELYVWGKQGLEIYERHSDIHRCAFCGSILTDERRKILNAYYNNEAARLKNKINELLQRIESEQAHISNIPYIRLSPNDFIESCKTDFRSLIDLFEQVRKNYVNQLDVCKDALINKLNNFIFVAQDHPNIDKTVEHTLIDWMSKLQKVILKHNETVSNFQAIKTISIEKYKKHLVARFLLDKKYFTIKSQKDKQEEEVQKYKDLLLAKQQEYSELLAKLKSVVKGQENLNHYIQLFLNRKDITVEVTDNEFFILKRGDAIAKNLSEGEKTAIAFSYFMVSLESIYQDGNLKNKLIFIDDPISSLDANHIAQVSSLINSFFFRKDAATGKVDNCFKQLFISTHNFEFYSFLRDANNIKRRKKILVNDKSEDHPACNFYMLKRISEDSTQLLKLPKSFSNYNSEYVYLFDEICSYKEDHYPENRAYTMPNIIRRFLEIYTLIKLPGNKDEIDNRVKLLIGEVNELKVLHYFSHFTTPERISKHSELILKVPDLVDDVFVLLRKDPIHLGSLLDGVNRKNI